MLSFCLVFGRAKALSDEPRSPFANGLGALTVLDGEVSSIRVVLACYRISTIGVSVNSLFRTLLFGKVVPTSPRITGRIFCSSLNGATSVPLLQATYGAVESGCPPGSFGGGALNQFGVSPPSR